MDDLMNELDDALEAASETLDVAEVVAETPEPETPEPTADTRAELEARALALGVAFRSTISDARLLERILAAEAAAAGPAPEVTSAGNPSDDGLDERTRLEMATGAALLRRYQVQLED